MSNVPVRPVTFHGVTALLITVSASLAVFFLLRLPLTWYHLLACWLLAVNFVTFGYYAHDKSRAQSGGRRIPEAVLHGLAVAGGTGGAYAGMRLLRHKTIKGSFRFVFWFIVVFQVAILAAVIYRVWKGG